MASRTKSSRSSGALRQTVSISASLGVKVRRIAKEHRLTIGRALVMLAERGVRAEQDAKENLRTTYRRFLKETEPPKKDEAGRNLIQAIFGKDALRKIRMLPRPR